jgi:hypothetical protein
LIDPIVTKTVAQATAIFDCGRRDLLLGLSLKTSCRLVVLAASLDDIYYAFFGVSWILFLPSINRSHLVLLLKADFLNAQERQELADEVGYPVRIWG